MLDLARDLIPFLSPFPRSYSGLFFLSLSSCYLYTFLHPSSFPLPLASSFSTMIHCNLKLSTDTRGSSAQSCSGSRGLITWLTETPRDVLSIVRSRGPSCEEIRHVLPGGLGGGVSGGQSKEGICTWRVNHSDELAVSRRTKHLWVHLSLHPASRSALRYYLSPLTEVGIDFVVSHQMEKRRHKQT